MMLLNTLSTLFTPAKVTNTILPLKLICYNYLDPESWRAGTHKYSKYITNYKHGNGFFCIPEYPYAGEVECFNFFVSNEVWNWASANGALSPLRK